MITNHVNGRVYVGKTTYTIEERFKRHIHNKKMLISKEIEKYGVENFSIECLEDNVPTDIILDKERYYIELHEDRCYNLYTGKKQLVRKPKKPWIEFTEEQKDRHRLSDAQWRSNHRTEESKRVLTYYYQHREEINKRRRKHE